MVNLLVWATGIIIAGLSISIYYLGKSSRSAQYFSFLCFITALWSFTVAINISTLDTSTAYTSFKLSYFFGSVISALFLVFSYSYPTDEKVNPLILKALLLFELILGYLILFSDKVISHAIPIANTKNLGWSFGHLGFIFDLFFILCWTLGMINLTRKFLKTNDVPRKRSLRLVILSFILGIVPVIIFGIIFPRLGQFSYIWITPLFGLTWFITITYTITKHQLFNIKILAIELVTFSLWIFILLRIFLAQSSREIVTESIFLGITIIFGIMLIRTVLHEVAQRKKIDALTTDLNKAYDLIKSLTGQ